MQDRFWQHVAKSEGCWEWTGANSGRGYGRVGVDGGKTTGAHRVSWEMHYGPVPDGCSVLHRCDNRPCVRPDHLFLGDKLANMADMVAKGRAGHTGGVRGDRHWLRRNPERAKELAALMRAAKR